jgi:hypothetical protein
MQTPLFLKQVSTGDMRDFVLLIWIYKVRRSGKNMLQVLFCSPKMDEYFLLKIVSLLQVQQRSYMKKLLANAKFEEREINQRERKQPFIGTGRTALETKAGPF